MRDWWACDGCGERVARDGNVLVKELAAQLAIMRDAHALLWVKLAVARGALYDEELSVCDKLAARSQSATNDCPTDELIDRAKAVLAAEVKP